MKCRGAIVGEHLHNIILKVIAWKNCRLLRQGFPEFYFPVGSRLVNPFANDRVPKALPNTHLMTTAPELGTGNIKKAGLDGTIKWLITPREEMNDTEFWESLTQ